MKDYYHQILLVLLERARAAQVPPQKLAERVGEILNFEAEIPLELFPEIRARVEFITKLAQDGQIEASYDEIAEMVKRAEPFF